MITKNQLKYFSALRYKKYRKLEKKFLVEGTRLVEEGINSTFSCSIVFVTANYHNHELIENIRENGIPVETIKAVEFQKLSDTKAPQGIAAVFLENENESGLHNLNDKTIVYLEDISDPGNLGTILRTADWFGVNSIILSEGTVEIYNPKVIRSSMGSVFHLNIVENTDLKALKILKEKSYNFICSDLEGKSIFDFQIPDKTLLFFCNEANGPSEKLLNLVDEKITIPGKGKAESLNVASAAAIILSQFTKDF